MGGVIWISEVIDISPGSLDSSLCFIQPSVSHDVHLAYKLNKQGDNTQPWRTPFPIWNQSVFPCPVLTVASWPAYRFLRRQVKWSGIPISLRIFHSLWWSTQLHTVCDISPFEGGVHYFHHNLVSGQTGGGENPSTEKQIKDLLSMAPPVRTRPSFPHSQSFPSGSFHKPLILIHQRAHRMKTIITEN